MRPGQSYDQLIDYLKSYEHAKPLLSLWLIATSKSAETVRDEIVSSQLIDRNDKLVVVDTTGDAASWHPAGIDWLKNNQV
jgi:hypothetical protein